MSTHIGRKRQLADVAEHLILSEVAVKEGQ
jgi:hypothetical protein